MHGERLLLFAKAPERGRVKTRLEPLLGADGALALHEALVRDVLARALARPGCDVVLYHDPAEPGPLLARLGVGLRAQRGADLGERLAQAFAEQAGEGAERVVVLGCDSPDLPAAVVDRAFDLLRRARLVIGPAVDGGYYLIGARGVPAAVLRDIPWGTAGVLAATLARVRAERLDASLLDVWYDVDRPEDLRFLHAHLQLLIETSGEDRSPLTRRLLESLLGRP